MQILRPARLQWLKLGRSLRQELKEGSNERGGAGLAGRNPPPARSAQKRGYRHEARERFILTPRGRG